MAPVYDPSIWLGFNACDGPSPHDEGVGPRELAAIAAFSHHHHPLAVCL